MSLHPVEGLKVLHASAGEKFKNAALSFHPVEGLKDKGHKQQVAVEASCNESLPC